MKSDQVAEFETLVTVIVSRFFAQNAQSPPPAAELRSFAARLWSLVESRGLPRPLGPGEAGAPGGMPDAGCGNLVARLLDPDANPLLAEAARQLLKACLYPEFTACRNSFRAVSPEGVCRRQQLARARGRISGSHCVDCPHWIALPPAPHVAFLAQEWQGDVTEFHAHPTVFLPGDFRALRRWLHQAARRPA
ncbi:MAG: hypothetical protein Q7S40_10110 [Opitutaceae bacterium]|nr:hypothetical protein [Opitutaceae bacterium]